MDNGQRIITPKELPIERKARVVVTLSQALEHLRSAQGITSFNFDAATTSILDQISSMINELKDVSETEVMKNEQSSGLS